MKRKHLAATILTFFIMSLFFTAVAHSADDYPSRNVEYVIGWGAGGGSDTFGRVINIKVRRLLKTNVVVVNMPGAASAVAMEYVLNQPADGYTLFGCTSELVSNQLQGRTKYTYKDFTPVFRAHVDVGMIQSVPNDNFSNWDEFVTFAKSGTRKIRLGGTGAASFDQIASFIILDSAGIADRVTYIPYESAGKMHAALMGGHIDAMYEEPGITLDLLDAGKMLGLISFTKKRLSRFPKTICAGEKGYEIPPKLWRGLVVKKGTPQKIVDQLEKTYTEAMKAPMYQSFEKNRLLTLFPGYMGSKEFAAELEREYKMYERVVNKLGFK